MTSAAENAAQHLCPEYGKRRLQVNAGFLDHEMLLCFKNAITRHQD